jgi:hypothetical protein
MMNEGRVSARMTPPPPEGCFDWLLADYQRACAQAIG